MEHRKMKVAGFGFREAATLTSLRNALDAARDHEGVGAVATLAHKACTPVFIALAEELGVPVRAISMETLAGISTPTRSERIMLRFRTGCIAEATALAGAGFGARLMVRRTVSADGMATAAIAELA